MSFRPLLACVLVLCSACGREALAASSYSDAPPANATGTEPDGGEIPTRSTSPEPSDDGRDGYDPTPVDEAPPCAEVAVEDTLERVPVDVVWVVDDSGSMLDEQARIRENIARFASTVAEAGIDMHVVIVTESDLAQGSELASSNAYRFVRSDVGSHDALEVLLETFDSYASQLRADAQTHFIVVTDDESRLAGATFRAQMEGLLGRGFALHAIASENVNGDACECSQGLFCGAAAPGDEYYALAAATGGEQVSICTLDWGAVFDRLVEAVVKGSPLPCAFGLPAPPEGETLDPSRVRFDYDGEAGLSEIPRLAPSGECGVLVAWHYDVEAAPTQIVLCESACTALASGGTVRIALGCEPSVVR